MDAILKTYFYVSDEQVQAIRTADSTQIQLIIEERVKNNNIEEQPTNEKVEEIQTGVKTEVLENNVPTKFTDEYNGVKVKNGTDNKLIVGTDVKSVSVKGQNSVIEGTGEIGTLYVFTSKY